MKEKIICALRSLDPLNENHWTGQGLARVDVVGKMANLPDLTRNDIAEAAPGFSRDTATSYFAEYLDRILADEAEKGNVLPDADSLAPSRLDALQAERIALKGDLETVKAERYALEQREREINFALGRLTVEIEAISPKQSTSLAIQTYQQRQNEIRVKNAERQNALLSAGLLPSEIANRKAPIDAAMAMNRRRGAVRPKFVVS
jgi:hypothetical protein